MSKNNPERFNNRADALVWLQSKGQISRGKFYNDCKAGFITIHPDKSVSKFQVAEYAEKVFRFMYKSLPPKEPAKVWKRPQSPSTGLFSNGQGLTMDTKTQKAETVYNSNIGVD
jgi:hypothetical protein